MIEAATLDDIVQYGGLYDRGMAAKRAHGGKVPVWHRPRYSLFLGRGEVRDAKLGTVWQEDWQPNALTNDGSTYFVNAGLKNTGAVASMFLGLITAATSNVPSATTHASDIVAVGAGGTTTVSEEAGGGYARQTVLSSDWGSIVISGGSQTTAAQKTFGPASGAAWTTSAGNSAAISYAFLTTGATTTLGTFVLYIALSGTTTVNVGQQFLYTLSYKQT